ncbi:MAG: hypothetical protein K2V38_09070 [Gemmataceae bacterium]|nr:hypothetical protein [Gemmataceae bacterium]
MTDVTRLLEAANRGDRQAASRNALKLPSANAASAIILRPWKPLLRR